MDGGEKSDNLILPRKPPNKGRGRPRLAEEVEGSGLAKGNPCEQTRHRAQDRARLQQAQARIREAAREDRKLQFWTNVNWVLDADLRGHFDSISHAWLLKFIEHRVQHPSPHERLIV